MTPPTNDPETLRHILTNTDALLLDFDGPICSVFSGIPASVVADQLRQVLLEGGYTDLPDDVRAADDPFDVLFYAAKLGKDEARYVEATFRAHEVEAVRSAQPTTNSAELMREWKKTGRPLAVVSNNSAAAVETYLDIHDLRTQVDFVSARASADVALLKPSPYLVTAAAVFLDVRSSVCTFVGDSTTDIEAAHAANVKAVAYANKKGKTERFIALSPSVIVISLREIVSQVGRNFTR